VVLTAGELSADGEDTLVNEGWEVRRVAPIRNPGTWTSSGGKRYPPRFWAVYTKLLIFNLTSYNTGAWQRRYVLRLKSLYSPEFAMLEVGAAVACTGEVAGLKHAVKALHHS